MPGTPLGLYLHIPFCRKRCKFCYFRVYTDKNARDVEVYLDALVKEVELLRRAAASSAAGTLQFVYFGGGTPSYLSAAQLRGLMTRLQGDHALGPGRGGDVRVRAGHAAAAQARSAARARRHPAEPGHRELQAEILEYNGRAHLADEIYRAYGWARELGFPQINIDLIAGMVGEDWDNWQRCVAQDDRAGARERHHLPDGAAVQHGLLEGADGARPGRAVARRRRLADQAGLGASTPSTRCRRPATRCRAPTRW